jgi:hypothetical protein
VEPVRFAAIARRLADAGVAVTVLPSTDLYLTGPRITASCAASCRRIGCSMPGSIARSRPTMC